MRMSNQSIPMETLLLAGLSDKISVLLWTKTKDGQKGRNRPPMILDAFNQNKTKQRETVVFNSGEDFEERRKELLKQATSGGGD